MTNLQADYKASRLNDLVTILVVQRTTAQATGNVGTQRDFNTSSGISGLAGHINISGLNNLLTAQSSTKLKGTGSTDASTTMNTSLAGQVIAVLPNGNLVVEAERWSQSTIRRKPCWYAACCGRETSGRTTPRFRRRFRVWK